MVALPMPSVCQAPALSVIGLIALGAVTTVPSPSPAVAQTTSPETTLALCETPSQTVRIYQANGETLMRAYDRGDNIIWMDRTPVSTETILNGTRYANLRGEQTVTTVVNTDGSTCTLQLGSNPPETGTLQSSDSTQPPLEQARQLYPDAVADLEMECRPPSVLDVQTFQNQGQPPRAQFTCWSAPDADGERTGRRLGNLPLTENDPDFLKPLTCFEGDEACETQLELVQTRAPETLGSAEFACSMKNGTLFFGPAGDTIDLRCGYMATSLWDTNGDGDPEYSDPVSVDESVGQVPL
jgi:hypothetical protein